MRRDRRSGKAGILPGVVVVGVLVIVGVYLMINESSDQKPEQQTTEKTVTETEIINAIEELGTDPTVDKGEEVPMMLRTVNERGTTMYISTEKVDIGRPGKDPVKAYKIASPLNRKMKPTPNKPSKHKFKLHPSQVKENENPEEVDRKDMGGQGGGEGEGGGATDNAGGGTGEDGGDKDK